MFVSEIYSEFQFKGFEKVVHMRIQRKRIISYNPKVLKSPNDSSSGHHEYLRNGSLASIEPLALLKLYMRGKKLVVVCTCFDERG